MSYNDVVQAIADAQTDAQTLEDVINGAPDVQVTARLGRQIWTLSTINSKIDYVRTQADAAVVTINDTKTSAVADIGTAKTGALASISTNQNAANAAIDSAESTALSSISTNQANANAAIDSAESAARTSITANQTNSNKAIDDAESAALSSINSNKDTAVTNINNLSSSSFTAVQKAKDDGIAAINADVTFVDNTKNSATTTINNAASNSQALLDSKVAELDNAISTAQASGAGANGWTADLIEYNGSTQKKFNDDLTGLIGVNSIKDMLAILNPTDNMRVFVRSYYAGFTVGGGVFIYHSANTDIYDGGVSFGKWRRRYDTLTPQCFGAIGDFTKRFLSTQFTNVTDAQKWFPHVTNIATDTLDWAGLQALFNYCLATTVTDVNVQGKYYTTKELNYVYGHNAKTRKFSGLLEITPNASMHHVIRIAGSFLQFDGIVTGNPNVAAYNIPYGIFIGGNLNSVTTINSKFGSLQATGFNVAGVNVNQNTMFCTFNNIRCKGGNFGKTTFSNPTQTVSGQYKYTRINLTFIPEHKSEKTNLLSISDYIDPNSFLIIENVPYKIQAIDRIAGTVDIYPEYKGALTTAEIDYFYGAGFHHGGNNAGCIEVGTISCYSGGTGISETSLYAGQYQNAIFEGCRAALTVGNDQTDPAMNLDISRAYFEGNTFDYILCGSYEGNTQLRMPNAMGLNPSKVYIRNINGTYIDANLSYQLGASLGNGVIDFGGVLVKTDSEYAQKQLAAPLVLNLTGARESRQYHQSNAASTILLRVDEPVVKLGGLHEMVVVMKGNNGVSVPSRDVVFSAPSGWTFNANGDTTLTFSWFFKIPIFYISVYYQPVSGIKRISIVCDGLKSDLQKNIIDVSNSTTVVYDPPSLATATQQSTTMTLTGAKFGDNVSVSFNQPLQGTRLWAEVTAADTVTVYHRNDTGATVDIASGNLKVKIV